MQKDLVFFKKEGEEGVAFKTWKDAKSQEYSKLKIAVPNSLLGVYNTVNSLGK